MFKCSPSPLTCRTPLHVLDDEISLVDPEPLLRTNLNDSVLKRHKLLLIDPRKRGSVRSLVDPVVRRSIRSMWSTDSHCASTRFCQFLDLRWPHSQSTRHLPPLFCPPPGSVPILARFGGNLKRIKMLQNCLKNMLNVEFFNPLNIPVPIWEVKK